MNNKLLLLCAPSGSGKTTVARMLVSTDNRFKHVQTMTTRRIRVDEVGRLEKIQVKLIDLEEMNRKGELINFNEKDEVHYGISNNAIASILDRKLNPVLEWDLNKITYWDNLFPVFKVILEPISQEKVLQNIKDGRDPEGKREMGVIREFNAIKSGHVEGDIIIKNFDYALMDTVQIIREAFFAV
jgi:guanylate kinase